MLKKKQKTHYVTKRNQDQPGVIKSACGIIGSMWVTVKRQFVTCGNCKRTFQ